MPPPSNCWRSDWIAERRSVATGQRQAQRRRRWPLDEFAPDTGKEFALPVEEQLGQGCGEAQPAKGIVFLVQAHVGAGPEYGDEGRHELDAIALRVVKLLAAIGRIQGLRP